ncbi:aldo/keto reductase [Haloparvum alkalitolerans]|uniref:aldo/keto reductase n=1 Tax=Haloparvum alkalitolerans TaxID=1042953 RepID=UPI003CEB17FA
MGIEDPAAVRAALDLGYRHLDTAQIYENEAVVGEGLAAALGGAGDSSAPALSRADVTVATKLWIDALAPDAVPESARASADRLGVDAIDLLYVHRPRGGYEPEGTLSALADLVDEGLVRHVGVSNFERDQLDRAVEVLADRGLRLAAHQTELHPLYHRPELLDHAREHGYPVVAYSPLAGGRAGEVEALRTVAEKHGTTPAAVSLAWVLAKDPVVAIPKASSEAHQRANLAAAALELDPEDVARIDAIDREEELYPE